MLPDSTSLLFFSAATLMVVIAPGPGMLFVISQGILGGPMIGVIAAILLQGCAAPP